MNQQNHNQIWQKSSFPAILPNEEIQILCRRDVNFLSGDFIAKVVWYLVFVVIYALFVNYLDEPSQIYLFRYFLGLCGGLLCIIFVADFQRYFLDYFVITNERVIWHQQKSFFAGVVNIVNLEKIKSVESVIDKFQPTNPSRSVELLFKDRFDGGKTLLPIVNNYQEAQKVFNKFLTSF